LATWKRVRVMSSTRMWSLWRWVRAGGNKEAGKVKRNREDGTIEG